MNTDIKKLIKSTKFTSVDQAKREAELSFSVGDTVAVYQKIKEGDKYRTQVFEGLVIAKKHGLELGGTFTVRKVASGVGTEKIYPVYSPNIEKIVTTKKANVRRSKLYYVRTKAVKDIRKKLKSSVVNQKLIEGIPVVETK